MLAAKDRAVTAPVCAARSWTQFRPEGKSNRQNERMRDRDRKSERDGEKKKYRKRREGRSNSRREIRRKKTRTARTIIDNKDNNKRKKNKMERDGDY